MHGRLRLPPSALRRVRELAEAAWPLEACGLLEGLALDDSAHVTRALACTNIHEDPARRYRIDPETYLRAEHAARARGRMITGVWHSHPHGDAAPSATDLAEAWPGWSYLIAGVTNGAMTSLRSWRLLDEWFVEQRLMAGGERR